MQTHLNSVLVLMLKDNHFLVAFGKLPLKSYEMSYPLLLQLVDLKCLTVTVACLLNRDFLCMHSSKRLNLFANAPSIYTIFWCFVETFLHHLTQTRACREACVFIRCALTYTGGICWWAYSPRKVKASNGISWPQQMRFVLMPSLLSDCSRSSGRCTWVNKICLGNFPSGVNFVKFSFDFE